MPTNTVASDKITLTGTGADSGLINITTTTATTNSLPYSTTVGTLRWDDNNNYWDTVEPRNWTKKNTFVINTLKEDPFAQCETEEEIEYVEHKIKELIYKMRDNALQRIKENA